MPTTLLLPQAFSDLPTALQCRNKQTIVDLSMNIYLLLPLRNVLIRS